MTEPAGDGRATEADVRASLPRTWFAFFGRFPRFTEVQRRAIPRVLTGEDLVVISPAASGKTESVTAPLVERFLAEGRTGLAILYVSPTRALVNDLFRRLAGPLDTLGLQCARKTGDHPTIDERRLPFLLLTTPESFDSLLGRHPRIFRALGAVVLDELHLIDNTPRGDQLRVLLERLRRINPGVRHCALSATIDDADIGRRYFADPGVVRVAGSRDLAVRRLALGRSWAGDVVAALREHDCRKVLVFFNARSSAESSAELFEVPPFRGRVWVHHASLTRKVREEVERAMNRERVGLLCCTSTLELGIDIGDVDAVVLVRPPFNVSSLLQRIGRGNRRTASPLFAIGLYANRWERFVLDTFVGCARDGRLHEKRYTPSLAVLPQQVASYMFQRRRIGTTKQLLREVLAPLAGAGTVDRVLEHMVERGDVVAARPGIYFLGRSLEKAVEYGGIHSNIQQKSFGKYEVRDVGTGRQLGTVFFLMRRFMLGGRAWETVEFRERERRILVRPLRGAGATAEVFEGTGTGGYGYRMAGELKSRLFPALSARQFPCFEEAGRTWFVHLLGSTYGFVLTEAFRAEGADAADLDGKLFSFDAGLVGSPPRGFPVPGRAALLEALARHTSRLVDNLGSGAFFPSLPPELQPEDHMSTLDIDGLVDFLSGIEPVVLDPDRVRLLVRDGLAREPDASDGRGAVDSSGAAD